MKDNILICGANWLGDSIMSMPAVQLQKQRRPESSIIMLVKSKLAPLWLLHPSVNQIVELYDGATGMREAVLAVKAHNPARAFIFPNSFRSALVPFLAGVPERIGMRGHWRAWMLTRVIRPEAAPRQAHQSLEYLALMGNGKPDGEAESPRIVIPSFLVEKVTDRLGEHRNRELIGLIPGAARGPSKRWPPEYFGEVGRNLVSEGNRCVLVFGSPQEVDLCSKVVSIVGDRACSMAGSTSLPELAALLSLCKVVITNDSGGMHLAAATGAPVVAVFGITDPATTGPMGKMHRVICAEGVRQSRDIARESKEAETTLRSITPDRVYEAARELLDGCA